jgi:hypothetical protein
MDDGYVRLTDAYGRYRSALEVMASIRPCPEAWPSDPPGPDYPGTRCQLLEGHTTREGTQHRHRMLGTQVTVTWD